MYRYVFRESSRVLGSCRSTSIAAVLILILVPTDVAIVQAQEKATAIRTLTLRLEPLNLVSPGRDITKLPQYDHIGSPSCSKDGEWVAFDAYKTVTAEAASPPECWVVRQNGTGLRKLSDGAAPRWSPDGKRLLFMREGPGDRGEELGVFVIDSDGTGERRVGPGRWPEWSPNGERIAFSMGGRGGGGARPMARIYTARADGSDERLICDGDCPSWSFDGKKIACCDVDPAHPAPEIRIVDLETGREMIVGFGWYRPNWSLDGKSVVCNGFAGPDQVMVRLSAITPNREPEPLLPGSHRGMSPCFGAKGGAIVFVHEQP